MSESLANKMRGLLASDVYTAKGRLRSDDLLVRERVGHGLASSSARLRDLVSAWRADRVPPSTREQPFPPPEVMEPMRKIERLIRAVDDCSVAVRGLPLLNADRVWDRVRGVGLDELLQFDWTLVGEADALATAAGDWAALDEVDVTDAEARLKRIRDVADEGQLFVLHPQGAHRGSKVRIHGQDSNDTIHAAIMGPV